MCWPFLLLLRFRCVSGGASPGPIRASLPTTAPAGFDEINDEIDALPDPKHLCAEERAAAMSHTAKLQNRLAAYLTFLAGAADTAGDSRVLGAGTTGSLVAIATNNPVAVGSGIVNTAKALEACRQSRTRTPRAPFLECMCTRS